MSVNEPPPREARGGSPGRRLTRLYVAALSTVALLSIGAQALIQWQLSNGESDSRVINVAGRQRMLSQRLTKCALVLQADTEDQQPARVELAETLDAWARAHRGLREGDAELGLPGRNSPHTERLFAQIAPAFKVMQAAAAELLATPAETPPPAAAVSAIRGSEADFLRGMDEIVSRYVLEAELKVTRLRRIESAILALTIGVLVAEGLLIFRPAVERIEATVHRQRVMRRRLRRAKAEAEAANEAKSRFLANVSHELRTPMTAVLGMAELAREERHTETRRKYLATMLEAGGSLQALLNDLIDLAQIDSGQLRLEPAPFRPSDVVDRVTRMMAPLAAAKGLSLTAWGQAPQAGYLLGDARRIEQVLINLVANAIKCTPSGDVSLGFTLAWQDGDASVVTFSVRDTGVGIGVPDQERVFEPFFRSRDGKPATGDGAGLGLAICRRIAAAMDAQIQLLSSEGIGSTLTFTARLPAATPPGPTGAASEPTSQPASRLGGSRVLIVEDTEVNQVLLREYLERAGWRATVVASGEDALREVSAARRAAASGHGRAFDAMVIDQRLPGISGVETARRVRDLVGDRDDRPWIVCVTADAGVASQVGQGVFDAVVAKPIDRAALLKAVAGGHYAKDERMPNEPQPASTFTAKLAAVYLGVCDAQLAELDQAIRNGDLDAGRLLAHRFRGQVGYFDEASLVALLGRLEQACGGGQREESERLMAEVAPKLTSLRQRLTDGTPASSGAEAVSSPRQFSPSA